MENRKTCFRCGTERRLSDFYTHPRMADGHLNKCKDCTRQDSAKRRAKKMKDPKWAKMEQERQRLRSINRRSIYPEKVAAMEAVKNMNRDGSWHWHHWSYLAEHRRDVIPMNPPDHRKAHTHMVYDQEQMKYRRSDNMQLLDTREDHEAYLRQVGCDIVELSQKTP